MMLDFYKIANRLKSDASLKKIFKRIPEALFVFIIDSENNYQVELLNDSACEMFEITKKDLLSNNKYIINERVFIEDREKVLQSLIDIRKNEKKKQSLNSEFYHQKKVYVG